MRAPILPLLVSIPPSFSQPDGNVLPILPLLNIIRLLYGALADVYSTFPPTPSFFFSLPPAKTDRQQTCAFYIVGYGAQQQWYTHTHWSDINLVYQSPEGFAISSRWVSNLTVRDTQLLLGGCNMQQVLIISARFFPLPVMIIVYNITKKVLNPDIRLASGSWMEIFHSYKDRRRSIYMQTSRNVAGLRGVGR